jgi:hypothetical protein
MGSGDLFRARFDQIINIKQELVQFAAKINWLGDEITPLHSNDGRPWIATLCLRRSPGEQHHHDQFSGHHVQDI